MRGKADAWPKKKFRFEMGLRGINRELRHRVGGPQYQRQLRCPRHGRRAALRTKVIPDGRRLAIKEEEAIAPASLRTPSGRFDGEECRAGLPVPRLRRLAHRYPVTDLPPWMAAGPCVRPPSYRVAEAPPRRNHARRIN